MSLQTLAQLRVDARPERLRLLRALVHSAMEMVGADREVTECVVLAVNEACSNVIRHAYGKQRAGEIVLEILNNRDEMRFRLMDFAPPVDRTRVCAPLHDELRPGGLGMHLIEQIMDEARFIEPPPGVGNAFEMIKRGLRTGKQGGC